MKRVLSLICLMTAMVMVMPEKVSAENVKKADIIFTHDLHAHLDGFQRVRKGKATQVGGAARLKTLIDKQKKKNPETLVVDAGDFSMGTLYQTLYDTEAVELSLMGSLGYDVVTLGNHEFDYGSESLSEMLLTAAKRKGTKKLPELVACNVDWSETSIYSRMIEKAFQKYGGKRYTMVQKGDVSIAVIGVMGKDAVNCAPTCRLNFEDPIDSVKSVVQEIRSREEADMIVCLSHSGSTTSLKTSEDEALAREVPELDLIISGHTHRLLREAIQIQDTYIVSCGYYGRYTGLVSMEQKADGRWKLDSYRTKWMGKKLDENEEILSELASYEDEINDRYLKDYGYEKNQVLAINEKQFDAPRIYSDSGESNIGDYLADAFLYGADHLARGDYPPADVALVPDAYMKDTLFPGEVTVSEVFDILPRGRGADGTVGYPLTGFYLTGAEIRTLAELDSSNKSLLPSAKMSVGGIRYTYNPNRLILNRLTDVTFMDSEGNVKEIENKKLYRVITDLHSISILGTLKKRTFGIINIVPKEKDGTPVEYYGDTIIRTRTGELKAWQAIAAYTESLQTISENYGEHLERKVIDDNRSLKAILKSPNRFAAMIAGAGILVLIVLVLLIWIIVKSVKQGRIGMVFHRG